MENLTPRPRDVKVVEQRERWSVKDKTMESPVEKFNLEKDSKKLKLFMFTIQKGLVQINTAESFRAVMAYDDESAVNLIRKEHLGTPQIFLNKRAEVEVGKIIDAVQFDKIVPQTVNLIESPQPIKEKTVEDFIAGLMLMGEKYITNKRDLVSLKRILSKVKV